MRRVLVGIFVVGLMVVMTASPGSACEPEIVIVEDVEGDQNKMYMDKETWEPTNQWADGTPVGSAAFLDIEYVMLVCSGGEITIEMKLYDRVTESTELPSGVKEVDWVIGVYHELVATDWFLDSYAVAVNWRGGDLEVNWVDLTGPNGPAVTNLYTISPGETGVDRMTVVLDADQSTKFGTCPLWCFGIRVCWNPTENGQTNYGGWFWVDLPDTDVLEEGPMEYPWY
jgi:hypothetical protein